MPTNMISQELLSILVCPETHTPLALAEPPLVAGLNAVIARGELRNRAGDIIEKPLDGGLVRQDRAVLYPIVDGIPVLLMDEAIALDSVAKRIE